MDQNSNKPGDQNSEDTKHDTDDGRPKSPLRNKARTDKDGNPSSIQTQENSYNQSLETMSEENQPLIGKTIPIESDNGRTISSLSNYNGTMGKEGVKLSTKVSEVKAESPEEIVKKVEQHYQELFRLKDVELKTERKQNKEKSAIIESLKTKSEEGKDREKKLETENKELKDENRKINNELKELRKVCEESKKKVKHGKRNVKECEELKKKVKKLEGEKKTSDKEKYEDKGREKKLETENQELKDETTKIINEFKELKKELHRSETLKDEELKTERKQKEEKSTTIVILGKERINLQTKYDNDVKKIEDEKAILEDKNAKLEDKNANLEDKNAKLEDKNAKLEKEYKSLDKEKPWSFCRCQKSWNSDWPPCKKN